MSDTEFPTIELNGVVLPLDPQIVDARVEQALRVGKYESPEVRATPLFLDSTDRVIELGSGIGYISAYIAKAIGVEAVTCVEANPALISYAQKVHRLNGLANCEVLNAVTVSDAADMPASGTLPFYVADPFWSSSLIRVRNAVDQVDIAVLRLSDLIRQKAATALVVDIEGGERDIFEKTDLGSVTKVFFELHKRIIRPSGVKKTFDDLSAQNFNYDQSVSSGGMLLFRKVTG